MASTCGLIAAGMAAAYVVWGEAVFYPLLLGTKRGPKLMSIFAYLVGDYSPLPRLGLHIEDPTTPSLPLMVLGAVYGAGAKKYAERHGAFAATEKERTTWLETVIARRVVRRE